MSNIQSVVTLLINGDVIPIKGNTFKSTAGLGETKVSTQSFGSTTQVLHAEDVTTKMGKIEFDAKNTEENEVLIENIKLNGSNNTVQFITPQGTAKSMTNAQMTNDVEVDYSPDGVIKVTLQGNPIK